MIKRLVQLIIISLLITTLSVQAKDGIFVVGETGWGYLYGLPGHELPGVRKISDTFFPSAYRASVGYIHDFFPFFGFGLEVGFGRYGRRTYCFVGSKNAYVSITTVEYLLNFLFHIKKIDLFAKVGVGRENLYVLKEDRLAVLRVRAQLFFGVNYNFTHHVALTLSYGHIHGCEVHSLNVTERHVPYLNTVLLGVRFTF